MLDLHDPDERLGLIVDEWGCWYDVEPGTNPGFLYQQNTMRDAVVAALYLNIFNSHSRRVVMANLAQTVNVLQAIILTDGEKMIKTPTYHVMDLFKEHMDGTLLYSLLTMTMKTVLPVFRSLLQLMIKTEYTLRLRICLCIEAILSAVSFHISGSKKLLREF